jgi:hypothetical protein
MLKPRFGWVEPAELRGDEVCDRLDAENGSTEMFEGSLRSTPEGAEKRKASNEDIMKITMTRVTS